MSIGLGYFKVFGVYTLRSAVVILTFSLFSALTCLTVFFIAHKSFGRVIAIRVGWIWALFPYAIHSPPPVSGEIV